MVVVLAGGVGGARFLSGLVRIVAPAEVTAIVNVGDDVDVSGLRVCPDLDTITYRLAGVVHPSQQWGRDHESFVVSGELRRFGHPDWFTLGDRDLAVHLHRTLRLRQGAPLSRVTDEIRRAFGVEVRLLPATDDPLTTTVTTRDGRTLGFQEYWVRERAAPEVDHVTAVGADDAQPAPGVVEAIEDADVVLFAPSNPVVSLGPILAVEQIRSAVARTRAPVVGVSPIIGGRVVLGMADRLLPSVGAEVSATGVARHLADLLDGWIVDTQDRDAVDTIRGLGIECQATDTMMDDPGIAGALASTCLDVASRVRGAAA
ncbi:MAG: 2-phospho-L-lactate transferase [Nitriliruptoraceae bacterium]